MDAKTLEIRKFFRDFDAEWSKCPVEKRQREMREAEEREARKEREAREQQRQAANISQEWWTAIDQRIRQYILQSFSEGEGGMAEGSHWPSTGYDPQGIQNRN